MSENIHQILVELDVPNLTYSKLIKTGKEASVHLVQDTMQLYALKIYKQNAQYSSQLDYLDINSVGDKRMQRAIAKGSQAGRRGLRNMWTNREFDLLQELATYSPNIPKVFAATREAILIEYLGTETEPAPRILDSKLTEGQFQQAFSEIIENIELFVSLGFVHGDLSAYNILWYNNQSYIIDFPQALDIKANRHAGDKLHKDLDNIRRFFAGKVSSQQIDKEFKRLLDLFYHMRTYGTI